MLLALLIYIDKPESYYYNITVSAKCTLLWKEEELLYYIAKLRIPRWNIEAGYEAARICVIGVVYCIDEKGTDI